MRSDLEHLRSVFMAVENGDLGMLKSIGIKDSELGDVKFFLEKLVKTGFLDWTVTPAIEPPSPSSTRNRRRRRIAAGVASPADDDATPPFVWWSLSPFREHLYLSFVASSYAQDVACHFSFLSYPSRISCSRFNATSAITSTEMNIEI